jgi:hypothetical protein
MPNTAARYYTYSTYYTAFRNSGTLLSCWEFRGKSRNEMENTGCPYKSIRLRARTASQLLYPRRQFPRADDTVMPADRRSCTSAWTHPPLPLEHYPVGGSKASAAASCNFSGCTVCFFGLFRSAWLLRWAGSCLDQTGRLLNNARK